MASPSRTTRVSVLLPFAFDKCFTYAAPEPLAPGTLVRVPLGARLVAGAVWDEAPDAEVTPRPVAEILDFPPLPEALMAFITWVAGYTLAHRGDVLALACKESLLRAPGRARKNIGAPMAEHAPPVLSAAQAEAAGALVAAAKARKFSVSLLEGVTGSGKTEVFLEAVAEILRACGQALVLLPEIALSVQVLKRFQDRFGAPPAVWHSELTPATRRDNFRAIAEGRARIVVGARSALFLPFPDLRLIVADEEHENAFKQEDGVKYHARDMAVVRAKLSDAACVLVSATPSLESVENAAAGRYAHLTLPARHGGAAMPQVTPIDLRADPPPRGRFLSPVLTGAMQARLEQGEQALLFLNRRGYAPLTLCRHCGHRMACPNCTAWLVEHRGRINRLLCHHCGHGVTVPGHCPACAAEHSFVPIGPGVERIAEEVEALFPAVPRTIMTSDVITGPKQAAQAAETILAGGPRIIIGTQMAAKSWHFPLLTLVGVVDADLGLAGGDLRAAEHTVQMLHQVAGRAGRAEAPGVVFLQTFSPEHPVMAALISGDLRNFWAREAAERRPGHWPPFGRLAALIVSATEERLADQSARELARAAPRGKGIEVLGPAPAPIALLRGKFRRRLLLKTAKNIAVQPLLRDWLARANIAKMARIEIDIDPVSFL